jgi:hypothetical protein
MGAAFASRASRLRRAYQRHLLGTIRRRSEHVGDLVKQQLQPATPAMVAVDLLACIVAVVVIQVCDGIPNRVGAGNFQWSSSRHFDTLRPYGRRVERFGRGEPDSIPPSPDKEGFASLRLRNPDNPSAKLLTLCESRPGTAMDVP